MEKNANAESMLVYVSLRFCPLQLKAIVGSRKTDCHASVVSRTPKLKVLQQALFG